uniref:(northern house mosquito) hypothetical protein n=1 Tax=Culex pipiens TaxID=7175 RepID=A0A8D8C4F8_CULPI
MAGGPCVRFFAARYSPIRSREAGGACVEDECDSIVVTVVTEDGDEPDPDEQEDEDASWAVASGEDAIMISVDAAAVGFLVGTTTGRWLRRSSCGPPPRGGAAPVEEGTSSGGIRVGRARRNVLVLRAKQEETVEPQKSCKRALAGSKGCVEEGALAMTAHSRSRSLSRFFFFE